MIQPFDEAVNIIEAVSKGNPGAITVCNELMYFSDWFGIMNWCRNNLSGADLWEKYKDVFHESSIQLGEWIENQILMGMTKC